MTKSAENKSKIEEEILRLEDIELKDGDDTKEDVYKVLLILYLLIDEPTKAKFLWKRIPQALKLASENSELNRTWKIGQNLITRKYPVAFQFATLYNGQWTNTELQQLVNQLVEKTKEDIFNLVSNAYSSINIIELANTVGLSTEETIKIALSLNWKLDESKKFLMPVKKQKEATSIPSSLKQLHELTTIVSYIDS